MEMMNRAIEDAADFRGMMGKIEADAARQANALRLRAAMQGDYVADRGESVQGNPAAPELQRQPGENRAEHRARLKRQRREAKSCKVPA